MADPGVSQPSVSLGRLPFSLPADRLRTAATEILADAGRELDRLRSAPASVDGLLRPLDAVLIEVRNVAQHGGVLFQVHPDAELRAVAREVSESAERLVNEFRVDRTTYDRLRAIDVAGVDPPTRHALEKLLREMRRAGVERSDGERAEILRLTNEIDRTANEFAGKISDGARQIELASVRDLAGLPPDYLAAHTPAADGTVRISSKYPDALPILSYADRAEVRRRMLAALLTVAYPENLPVLDRMLRLRHEYAGRLGYPEYATFATEDKMLGSPDQVTELLDRVAQLLTDAARADLARFLARKRRDEPGATGLEPWDAAFWGDGYYDTKIRAEEFGVDPRRLRAYLPYGAIRDGLFTLCHELFGLSFVRAADAPTWHPDVEAYDVHRDGRLLGRCYLDLVPRDGKYNHAAEFEVRVGVAGRSLPQAALVCNFVDPRVPRETARMEYRNVITFFHEFGHLLHALLSGHGPWLYTSMSFIEWDFVEAPSQLFEEWARDPATLGRFARDPDSGEPIPADLLRQVVAAEALGRGSRWLRQVALASISLEMYRRDPAGLDTDAVFRDVWESRFPEKAPPEYHPQAAWGHLAGYTALYYTYVWSAVIARDLLTPFGERGSLTDPETAARYADEILVPGSTRPAAELVRRFLGREIAFDAFATWALAGRGPQERKL